MKKVLAVLFALIIVSAASAYAEDIVLPAGLKFGMTVDEAVAVSGFKIYKDKLEIVPQLSAWGFDGDLWLSSQDVSLGGKKVFHTYVFFLGGKLKQISYLVTQTDNDTDAHAVHESWLDVENSLQKKYGKADITAKHLYQHKPDAAWGWPINDGFVSIKHEGFENQSTYVVPQSKGSVYIDNYTVNFRYQSSIVLNHLKHFIDYTYYEFDVDEAPSMDADF